MSTNTNNNNPHDSGVASRITTTTNDDEQEEQEDHSSNSAEDSTANESPARLVSLQISDVEEEEVEEEAEEDVETRIRRGGWTLPPVLDRYSWRRDDTARNHDLLLARAAAINRLAQYVDQIISELLRQNPELRQNDNAEEKEEDERR